MTRSYSKDDWFRAKDAWAAFPGPLWEKARQACREWTIWPPSEHGQDWRDAPHPSQRVMIWFALDARPAETLGYIRAARSWSGVIDRIYASEGQRKRSADFADETAELERKAQANDYRGAMQSLGQLLGQWKESI